MAHLERARLSRACLEKVDLRNAYLEGANLSGANLEGARLSGAHLQGARLTRARLEKANLKDTHLEQAYLWSAHLEGARLTGTHLEHAHLWDGHLEGAHLLGAHLEGADLTHASFDNHSYLEGLALQDGQHGSASLVDINWNGANLAVIKWERLTVLGEEQAARQSKTPDGKGKDKDMRLEEYQTAVRANRQLAVVLREQGLNEEADRFAYRAQLCQRIVWRWQRRPLNRVSGQRRWYRSRMRWPCFPWARARQCVLEEFPPEPYNESNTRRGGKHDGRSAAPRCSQARSRGVECMEKTAS